MHLCYNRCSGGGRWRAGWPAGGAVARSTQGGQERRGRGGAVRGALWHCEEEGGVGGTLHRSERERCTPEQRRRRVREQ